MLSVRIGENVNTPVNRRKELNENVFRNHTFKISVKQVSRQAACGSVRQTYDLVGISVSVKGKLIG